MKVVTDLISELRKEMVEMIYKLERVRCDKIYVLEGAGQ
jgi:hypothetical protein